MSFTTMIERSLRAKDQSERERSRQARDTARGYRTGDVLILRGFKTFPIRWEVVEILTGYTDLKEIRTGRVTRSETVEVKSLIERGIVAVMGRES